MAMSATVSMCGNEYIAVLNDGRRLAQRDWLGMAEALFCAGIRSRDVHYEWHNGQRMITAGQQVALRAEIRRLGREVGLHEAAA